MTFFDDIDSDIDDVFFSDFAEPANYNGVLIDVVVNEASEQTTDIPGFVLPVKTIMVKEKDISKPKAGDLVIMEGLSYRVGQGVKKDGRGIWSVPLSRQING